MLASDFEYSPSLALTPYALLALISSCEGTLAPKTVFLAFLNILIDYDLFY